MMQCSLIDGYQYYRETCFLRLPISYTLKMGSMFHSQYCHLHAEVHSIEPQMRVNTKTALFQGGDTGKGTRVTLTHHAGCSQTL